MLSALGSLSKFFLEEYCREGKVEKNQKLWIIFMWSMARTIERSFRSPWLDGIGLWFLISYKKLQLIFQRAKMVWKSKKWGTSIYLGIGRVRRNISFCTPPWFAVDGIFITKTRKSFLWWHLYHNAI